MNKFFSLLKAILSSDMALFKYKSKSNNKGYKKVLMPIVLSMLFMFGMGSIYNLYSMSLFEVNLGYLMLAISMIIPLMFTFIQGIYKSSSMLYECKDNDLLLSLPIEKKYIIIARLIKLFIYQFIYSLLFILPAYIIYILNVKPSTYFYIISLIEIILLPIIPTILASFIGYFIKNISSKFKRKKQVQTIVTFIIFFGIYFLIGNIDLYMEDIINNAKSINDMISYIYYPIGLYLDLINKFNLIKLVELLLLSIIPLILFIYIISINYNKVLQVNISNYKNRSKKIKYQKKSIIASLTLKELKKYFSSSVYVFNTMFSCILLVIATISISINFEDAIKVIVSNDISNQDINMIKNMGPIVYYCLIIVFTMMTFITSSSISIEGKSFNITKSLPVSIKDILYSKILCSLIICYPFILVSNIIFIIFTKINIIDILFIILISIMLPIMSSLIGLIVNLRYPKMNYSSDAEVVKQSMSSFISIIIGLILDIILIGILFIPYNINLIIIGEIIFILVSIIILYNILITKGIKRFMDIEV